MHHRTRPLICTAAATAALALTGCGISNPYSPSTTTTTKTARTASSSSEASTVNARTPVHERGGTIPPAAAAAQNRLAAGAGASTPQKALTQYVTGYITWTSTTVAKVQRRLASISLGGARAQALQAAASYGADTTLQSSQVANTGQILSIAKDTATAGDWVIVTRETTTGSGNYASLPPADHIYLAALTHLHDRWVVNTWSPQS